MYFKGRLSKVTILLMIAFFLSVLATTAHANQKGTVKKIQTEKAIVKVNINTAGVLQLTALPGVGASLAEQIVKYRTEVRKFETPSDLVAVKGIGQKKLDKMIKYLAVK